MALYDYLYELFKQMVLDKEEGVEYCTLVRAGVNQDITKDIYVPKKFAEELVTGYRGIDPMSEFFLCDLAQDKVPKDIQLAIIEMQGFKHCLENLVSASMAKILSGVPGVAEGDNSAEGGSIVNSASSMNPEGAGESNPTTADNPEGAQGSGDEFKSEASGESEETQKSVGEPKLMDSGSPEDSQEGDSGSEPTNIGSPEDSQGDSIELASSGSPEDSQDDSTGSETVNSSSSEDSQEDSTKPVNGGSPEDNQENSTEPVNGGSPEDSQGDPIGATSGPNPEDNQEDSTRAETGAATSGNPEAPETSTTASGSSLDQLVNVTGVAQTPLDKAKGILIKLQKQAHIPDPSVPENGVVSIPVRVADGVESVLFDLTSARLSFIGEDGVISASAFGTIENMLSECLLHISTELLHTLCVNPVTISTTSEEEIDFTPQVGDSVNVPPASDIFTPPVDGGIMVPQAPDIFAPQTADAPISAPFIGDTEDDCGQSDSSEQEESRVPDGQEASAKQEELGVPDGQEAFAEQKAPAETPAEGIGLETNEQGEESKQLTEIEIALQAIELFVGSCPEPQVTNIHIYSFTSDNGESIQVLVDIENCTVSYVNTDTETEVCSVKFDNLSELNSRFLCNLSGEFVESHYTPPSIEETNSSIIKPVVDSLKELAFAFSSFDDKNRQAQLAGFNCDMDSVMEILEEILGIYLPDSTVGISSENRCQIINDTFMVLEVQNIAPPSKMVDVVECLLEEVVEALDEAGLLLDDNVKQQQADGIERINAFIKSATI